MKKSIILAAIAAIVAVATALPSPAKAESPFPYPMAPDSLGSLNEKTTYVMTHFWDQADLKKVMADTAALHTAMHDYLSFIPYANPDSIKKSISRLTSAVAQRPADLLKLAHAAQREIFDADADFWANDQYLQFVRPVLSNKKIKQRDKDPFLQQIQMLNSSQMGSTIAPFTYTTRHDATHSIFDDAAQYKIVLFIPGECDADCRMLLLRLDTDIATTNLVKNNRLKIYVINPGNVSKEWKADMERYPYSWEIGYNPEVGDKIDVRRGACNYLLDADHRIVGIDLSLEQMLAIAAGMNLETPAATQPAEQ